MKPERSASAAEAALAAGVAGATEEVIVNRRKDFGSGASQFNRSSSYPSHRAHRAHRTHRDHRARAPRREPSRFKEPPEADDDSITGCEMRYFETLMQSASSLVIVLQQGDQIVGRLAWYDHACLKITPVNGSPSLLIP